MRFHWCWLKKNNEKFAALRRKKRKSHSNHSCFLHNSLLCGGWERQKKLWICHFLCELMQKKTLNQQDHRIIRLDEWWNQLALHNKLTPHKIRNRWRIIYNASLLLCLKTVSQQCINSWPSWHGCRTENLTCAVFAVNSIDAAVSFSSLLPANSCSLFFSMCMS